MKGILLSLVFLSVSFFSFTQGIPEKPNPPKLVNNFSKEFPDFLNSGEMEALETKLESFATETSNQILVVVVDDLDGLEPWEYAAKLGDKWKVGQEQEDNGVILLIKPTGGKGERKTFIAPGRGLEGAIPDLTANDIVENELLPNFRDGNFYEGVDKATDVIMSLAKGEYNSKDYSKKKKGGSVGFIIVAIIIGIIVLLVRFGPKGNGRGGGFTYGGGGFYGGFGGSSFGGGSSSGGGGFGGFGGGSFGGGGSGGSW